MARFIPNPVRLFILIGLSFLCIAHADVKLRIYMQDGTLRAGTLIQESDSMFVILSKSGREEVPKNKIMYVNGKTLTQWQARPDKLYQTEILPSEIPNPGYVNNKALPPPTLDPASKVTAAAVPKGTIAAADVKPSSFDSLNEEETPEATPPAAKAPVPTKPTAPVNAAPANTAPAVKTAAVVPSIKGPINLGAANNQSPAVVPIQPVPNKTAMKAASSLSAPARVVVAKKRRTKKVPPAESQEARVIPTSTGVRSNPSARPLVFDRDVLAAGYYQSAQVHLANENLGRAIQDLHKATLLNKGDDKSFVLLGQLYEKENLPERAKKYYSNPILKHNQAALDGLARLEKEAKAAEKRTDILYAEAGGGFVLAFLLAIVMSFLRKKKAYSPLPEFAVPGVQVESAEGKVILTATEPVSMMTKEINAVLTKLEKAEAPHEEEAPPIVSSGAFERPSPLESQQTQSLETAAEKTPKEKEAVEDQPASSVLEEARRGREEILKAIARSKEKADEKMDESAPPAEPVIIPFEPSPQIRQHDDEVASRQDILRVAAEVDQTLSKANAWAEKGDLETASREYRTAMALDPNRIDCYLGLGFVYFQWRHWDAALHFYLKAVEIDPNSADGHYGIGRIYIETDQMELAVEELRKSLQLDPSLTDAQDSLALLGKTA